MKTLFITGGAGFIGSALIRLLISNSDWKVVCIDKLTYAGNFDSLMSVSTSPRFEFVRADICDRQVLDDLFRRYEPLGVIHLAAESHVDRSIHGPGKFIQTNILGTYTLLEASCAYWSGAGAELRDRFRFHHVSTDEVFGSLGSDGFFTEDSPYRPSSPYAASKAASDHLVRAWGRTYGLPVIVSNCSNNFGPYQFPEKLIPLMIQNAIAGKDLPIYGDGMNVRDWLYVDDHARALLLVFEAGTPGCDYLIGGECEKTNLEVIESICVLLDEMRPRADGRSYAIQKVFVKDRPGHDRRYAVDCSNIKSTLGWRPLESFETGLRKTVRWYLENEHWVTRIVTGEYQEWIEKNYGGR